MLGTAIAGLAFFGAYSAIVSPFDLINTVRAIEYLPHDETCKKEDSQPLDPTQVSLESTGTIGAIRRIGKVHGYKSLWKGNVFNLADAIYPQSVDTPTNTPMIHQPSNAISTHSGFYLLWANSFLESMLDDTLVPVTTTILQNVAPTSNHALEATVLASLLTRILLTPLSITRTRLQLDPTLSTKQALKDLQTTTTTSSWSSMYNPHVLAPHIASEISVTAIQRVTPWLLTSVCGINRESTPVLYRVLKAGVYVLFSFAFVMPLETVSRRMEWQVSQSSKEGVRAIVRTNRKEYTGMRDCVERVVIEEGEKGKGVFGAWKGLWRGWRIEVLGCILMALFDGVVV
ncbi:hypothetical protein HDU79_007033 [Rhizoclosmatium sp. JEL0117]|nr:hypothetical protein HDU79_007033 [Rhizoclosmatium sp. JEL0117]